MTAAEEQLHAIVHGRVQGVNYRYYTVREATRLELTGWVRNRRDGTVEVLAEGSRAQLDQLVTFLQRGPSSAKVQQTDLTWREVSGTYDDFTIRYGSID